MVPIKTSDVVLFVDASTEIKDNGATPFDLNLF